MSQQPDPVPSELKIGVVGQNLVRRDGQGRWMLEIVRALAARGHVVEVHSFTLDADVAEHPCVRWHRIPTLSAPQLLIDLWMIVLATARLSKLSYGLVCILGPCVFVRGPYLYFAAFSNTAWRDTWRAEGPRQDLYRRIYGRMHVWLEQLSLRKAKGLVAMSKLTASELSAFCSPDALVEISPGGADEGEFSAISQQERISARQALSIAKDTFVMALIGEFATGRKGLDVLARALATDLDQDEILLVRGSGPKEKMIRSLEEIGVSERVRLLGTGPAREVLAASDVVVVPSSYEPFSLVALEAAASHLPLILSDRVGAADYLEPAGAALVIDPLDPKSIRRAIDELKRPDVARRIGRNGSSVSERMEWGSVSLSAVRAIEQAAEAVDRR